jgi:thymidylate kinase
MQHIIFEGAELAGKSWLMSRVYDYLEPKYNKNRMILDGCHWFNCDVGVFGTRHGRPTIKYYLKILEELENKNLLLEKFHLSDVVYNRLHLKKEINYKNIEKELLKLNFKIVLVVFSEDKNILEKRIADRLKLYPHYERILRSSEWYIKQQREYLKEIKKTKLPYLIIETKKLPDESLVQEILSWMGEK